MVVALGPHAIGYVPPHSLRIKEPYPPSLTLPANRDLQSSTVQGHLVEGEGHLLDANVCRTVPMELLM